ncbi:MAG: hypothetical protein QM779_17325 [Propionicimonas sp.]|uniref:hypothetical protein n=1 Tax=Propionicimonas sp. TaxID=1955623 RepID=UPI003D114869
MWGDRVAWLGRPWFFVAVVVLAVNDHVLKGAWPGWLTGKLSDVAGVAVVATLLAVLMGATRGTVVAGLAFVLLKTVPGVAEAAAPLLGGVTLRDPSDLVALVVLPPLWLGLNSPRPDQARRTRRGWALVGLLAGTLSVTATSAPMEVPLVSLGSGDGAIYAEVDPGEGFDDVLLATTDGGRSWAPLSRAAVTASVVWEPIGSHAPRYAQACADDGVCFRTLDSGERGALLIERSVERPTWQFDGMLSTQDSRFADIAVDTADSEHVVALGPERTVFVRYASGDWVATDLTDIATPRWQRILVGLVGNPLGVLLSFFLACTACVLLAPREGKVRGVIVTHVIGGFLVFVLSTFGRPAAVGAIIGIWWLVLAVGLLPMLARSIAARRRRTAAAPSWEGGDDA